MKGRYEHKVRSEQKMREFLQDKPDYIVSFYNRLFATKQYLTAQNYTLAAVRFMNYLYKNGNIEDMSDLSGFNADNVACYISSLKGRAGGECSDSLKATTWAALNKFGEYLLDRELINKNPMRSVDKQSVDDPVKHFYLKSDELRNLVKKVEENQYGTPKQQARRRDWIERNVAILKTLIATGMRVTALTEINVEDFDPVNNTISVIDKGKTPIEYGITEDVSDSIQAWLEKREKLLAGRECEALFISNRRSRITSKAVRDFVSECTADMDKHITPHKFRSSYGCNLYVAGMDVLKIQRNMKHKKIETTERYLEGLEFDKYEAAKLIENSLQ